MKLDETLRLVVTKQWRYIGVCLNADFFFSVCAYFCSKSSKAKYLKCSDTQFSKTNKTLSMHAMKVYGKVKL